MNGVRTVTEWLTAFRFFFLVTRSAGSWSGVGSEEDGSGSGVCKDGDCWKGTSEAGMGTLLDVVQRRCCLA